MSRASSRSFILATNVSASARASGPGGVFSGIKIGVKPAPMDSEFPYELDVAYEPPMPVRIGKGLIPWPELHRASLFQGNRVRHRPPAG
jgi:hypothetical protein